MRRIVVYMSSLIDRDAIATAALEHGVDADVDVLLAVIRDAFAPHETMTAGEREFLIAAGAPVDSFDPKRQSLARARLAARAARAVRRTDSGLTTAQVAVELGRAASNIRRSVASRDLYAISGGPHRELLFPEWQFVDGKPLRGLRQVLTALPATLHPLAVESFMLGTHEELDDLAPVTWLDTGGDIGVVVWLAESFARR